MAEVTVIGGGVIGLTSALALQEAGHEVRVVAERTGEEIVSAVAGAIWFPFRASPPELVNRWALRTFERLERIARDHPEAGVDMLRFYQCVDDDSTPWYAGATPGMRLVCTGYSGPRAAPGRAPLAWEFAASRVEPALFQPWLERRLRRPIERRRVASLREAPGDVVVNCTGLEARALTGDSALLGVYGHVLVVEPGDIPMRVSISDDRREGELFYTIPRRTTVIVGGCSQPSADDRPLVPEPAMREEILRRCREHGFTPGAVLAERTGLRPYRSFVRVERDAGDARVIHNYGHGGAGYTVMHGCAEEVVRLVEEATGGGR